MPKLANTVDKGFIFRNIVEKSVAVAYIWRNEQASWQLAQGRSTSVPGDFVWVLVLGSCVCHT